MRNEFFNLSRFIKLAKKDFSENYKTNLLRIVMLYGICVVIIFLVALMRYNNGYGDIDDMHAPMYSDLAPVFVFLLGGSMCLYASFMMDWMKTKTKRISLLMNPATSFEKFSYRWLITTIVFVSVFICVFLLADYTRVIFYSIVFPELNIIPIDLFKSISEIIDGHIFLIISIMFVCQSFFILGSTIWYKNAFIKTCAFLLLLEIAYNILWLVLYNFMLEGLSFHMITEFPSEKGRIIAITIMWGTSIFNWILSYFRFKESEIIHRY